MQAESTNKMGAYAIAYGVAGAVAFLTLQEQMLKDMQAVWTCMGKKKTTEVQKRAFQIVIEKAQKKEPLSSRDITQQAVNELSIELNKDQFEEVRRSVASKMGHLDDEPPRGDAENPPPPPPARIKESTQMTADDIEKLKAQLDEERRAVEERRKELEQKALELAEQAKKIEASATDIQMEVASIKPYVGKIKDFNFPLWMWSLYQLEESYGFNGSLEDYVAYLGDYYVRSNNKALALIDVSVIAILPKEARMLIKIFDTRPTLGKVASNVIMPEKATIAKELEVKPDVKPEQEEHPIEYYLKIYGDKAGIPLEEMKQRLAGIIAKMKENTAQ